MNDAIRPIQQQLRDAADAVLIPLGIVAIMGVTFIFGAGLLVLALGELLFCKRHDGPTSP